MADIEIQRGRYDGPATIKGITLIGQRWVRINLALGLSTTIHGEAVAETEANIKLAGLTVEVKG